MMVETITYRCTRCQSTNIIRNGHTSSGNPKYRCTDCGASRAWKPKVRYTEEQKALLWKTYFKRGSMRGIHRLFGVSGPTLITWIKKAKSLPALKETLVEGLPDDVLELKLCTEEGE